jgi:hypothetical protein
MIKIISELFEESLANLVANYKKECFYYEGDIICYLHKYLLLKIFDKRKNNTNGEWKDVFVFPEVKYGDNNCDLAICKTKIPHGSGKAFDDEYEVLLALELKYTPDYDNNYNKEIILYPSGKRISTKWEYSPRKDGKPKRTNCILRDIDKINEWLKLKGLKEAKNGYGYMVYIHGWKEHKDDYKDYEKYFPQNSNNNLNKIFNFNEMTEDAKTMNWFITKIVKTDTTTPKHLEQYYYYSLGLGQ